MASFSPSLWLDLGLSFAVALAVSALGFRRLVYFVSLGYAFSVTGGAALALGRSLPEVDVAVALHLALLMAYGLRLGTYLTRREREPAYQRELEDAQQRAVGVTRPKQVGIWLAVSLLYVLMLSPALFHLQRLRGGGTAGVTTWLGLLVMGGGLLLEALADRQKAAFKRAHPTRFCDVKLYRVVRCPNYLGEIVFWVGSFAAGAHAYAGLAAWLCAAAGLLCIVLIMMGSTKRLEGKQAARYGSDPAYQRYVREVPVLFPLVPLYSLQGVRVYLE